MGENTMETPDPAMHVSGENGVNGDAAPASAVDTPPVAAAAPLSEQAAKEAAGMVPMPVLQQSGEVFVGPGAEKEAALVGLGLTKLKSREKDKLYDAKRYALDISIKQIMLRQQQTHQQNQQKQQMYGQALSLMARVYIGSISFEVREENIKKSFEVFGPIKSINMSWDATTGHHKGFAFLEYEVPEAAVLAQDAMNGLLMGGRNLKVGRPSNMPQAQPIIEMVQNDAKKYHRVYVASVHPDLSETDLKSVFEAFGEVVKCQLARQSATGKGSHRGFGYIEFNNATSMNEAIAGMNMFDLGGQFLRVGKCITPPEALLYIVPQATSALPTSAAVALAAITAKVQALEATGGGSPQQGSASPGQASPARQASPAPIPPPVAVVPPTPVAVASPTLAQIPSVQVPGLPGAPAIPPPPSVALPPVPPPPPVLTLPTQQIPPPPPQIVVPPIGQISMPPVGQIVPPAPSSGRRGFGGFAPDAPAPSIVPPPGVAQVPGVATPKVKPPKPQLSILERIKIKTQNVNEKATFGALDEKFRPKDPLADKEEQEGEQLAIAGGSSRGDVQSMALSLLEGSGALVGLKNAAGGGGAAGVGDKKMKKKKIKPPKVKGPQLNSEAALAAAEKAGQMNDAIIEKEVNSEEATLASQEGIEIRGNESRHLLMTKLMRINRSHVLLLKNMVVAEEIDEYLEQEIKDECSKYGTVDEVLIVNDESAGVVKIFVKFVDPTQVDKAKTALDGRFFAGRTIIANVYDQAMYDHGDYTG